MKLKNTKLFLKEIAHQLMLNTCTEKHLGLLNGKIGMTIFFLHYSQYSQDSLYEDFAGELIKDIYKGLHTIYSYNFQQGLCGIGFGMEHLLQHQFVEADEDNDIFLEPDKRITDLFLFKEKKNKYLCSSDDIARYIISRYNHKSPGSLPIFNEELISFLITDIQRNKEDREINSFLIENMKAIINYQAIQINTSWILKETIAQQKKNLKEQGDSLLPLTTKDYICIGLDLILEDIQTVTSINN